MPYNGSGTFNLFTPGNPVVTDTVISSSVFNSTMSDVATALSTAMTRNGQSPATANIPLGGNKLTGVGLGSVATDAATIANLQSMTGVYVATVGGTATAITLSPSPAISAYAVGQVFAFIAGSDSAGATTVAVSGLAAKALTRSGAVALGNDNFLAGQLLVIMYDGTRFQLFNSGHDTEYLYINDIAGIDPSGVTAATNEHTNAIAAAKTLAATTGKNVDIVYNGTYLLSGSNLADGIKVGIHIAFSAGVNPNDVTPRVRLVGRAFLKANSNTMEIMRISDSHCGFNGVFMFFANSKTAIHNLCIKPDDTTQNTTAVYQMYVKCIGYYIATGDEGIVLQVGPKVGPDASACSYGEYRGHIYGPKRSIWLKSSTVNQSSGCDRNEFHGVIGHDAANTGIQVDGGSGNRFYTQIEGCAVGTSPNNPPTGTKIANQDAWGLANDNNELIFVHNESNTRDLDNANVNTRIIGGFWDSAKFGGGGVVPQWMLGLDPNWAPYRTPFGEYGVALAGYANGYYGMRLDHSDVGYPWTTNSLNIGDLTNVASLSGGIQSMTTSTSHTVNWVLQFNFQASVAGTRITCNVPIAPISLYTTAATNNPWFSFWVNNGVTLVHTRGGFTSTGLLYIDAPSGNWDTGGANNQVWVNIEYKR
jgi:hypothetical protein